MTTFMKVALVHDYIKEYGGAERVLEALCEMYPDAPIYTSFYKEGSVAYEKFKDRKIITSWVQHIPFFSTKLHSPLRFLAPFIWNSFDFSEYDVVITSASWYITKGVVKRKEISDKQQGMRDKGPIEICYCHTPPRWLYGYTTSVEWQKYWPIKLYGMIVGHFMRMYDFNAAQRVHFFIANSKEVKERIAKFYRRESTVIYPPVALPIYSSSEAKRSREVGGEQTKMTNSSRQARTVKRDYYFIVARLVGGKGLRLAVEAANQLGISLKIAGVSSGYSSEGQQLSEKAKKNIEFLGRVSDEALIELYSNAKAFLALATDEDFGITPVESMLCGTPVIAYDGGGYKETVVEGKTGIFFKEPTVESLTEAIKRFETMRFDPKECRMQAEKFSKERFKKEMKVFIDKIGGQNP
jgi:glycosyltransferase involved in cell wall biosynthesis